MTSKTTDTGGVQVLHYLKRNRKFTRDQFWAYWKDIHGPKLVPLAEKYGFTHYQQLRTFGKVTPASSPESAPNVEDVESKGETAGLVEFDGIAMFLVPSLDSFKAAVEDPYYLNVVQPDEYNLMDKSAPGRGVVASFQGLMVPIVQNGDDVTGDEQRAEVQKSREAFAEISGVAKA
ncbi:hypothetical protein INS49_013150 [Diaporthe citri]|uniref:uncharacterized protein n=1 Tax=Diaporthe citri TaxID=83186 RepID=UPI001C7FD84B|nr:uncharacterized protein INS49_013150 [Diaporthe citri]KAG6359628.1 hypothetical protein INS49_013150 [Diaporthe citri]